MLCSECNKKPAILFYKKIENGKETMEGYCYDCAQKHGIDPSETITNQHDIIGREAFNIGDMSKQLETLFKDLAQNINLEDVENIEGAITFESPEGMDEDGSPKITGAAIPLRFNFLKYV